MGYELGRAVWFAQQRDGATLQGVHDELGLCDPTGTGSILFFPSASVTSALLTCEMGTTSDLRGRLGS